MNKMFYCKKMPWLILGAIALYLLFYHVNFITFPYQHSIEESSMMFSTQLMLNNQNPYSYAVQPLFTNVYGIGYPLAAYPFVKLFGPHLAVYRCVSGLFVFLSCGLLWLILRTYSVQKLVTAIVVVILYGGYIHDSTPLVRPDSLGLFLFLASIYIPHLYKYSYRSLGISIILGIMAFYSKAYFVLAIPYVALYLFLCVSKKRGVFYTLGAACVGLLSIAGIGHVFECYYSNTFFNHINIATSVALHSIGQFIRYAIVYANGLVVVGIMILVVAMMKQKTIRISLPKNVLNVYQWDAPFLSVKMDPNTLYLIVSTIIVFFYMGRHAGASMTYLFHLITPFFIITVCRYLTLLPKGKWMSLAVIVLLMLNAMGYNYIYHTKLQNYAVACEDWRHIIHMIQTHDNVLHSQIMALVVQRMGRPLYNAGQTFYFQYGYNKSPILNKIADSTRIKQIYDSYVLELDNHIRNRNFDLVFINERAGSFVSPALLTHYYDRQPALNLHIPHSGQVVKLDVYKPKKGENNENR